MSSNVAYKVFASEGERLVADYLFAERADAELFKTKMEEQGYKAEILITEV